MSVCICGHDHNEDAKGVMSEGRGHGRSMGRAAFAAAGGFFVLNSFLLEWFFPEQTFASQISAVIGAIVLAMPIFIAAVRDLCVGRVYMNELVALAILAAFAGGEFREAGIISFFRPGISPVPQ